MISQETIKEFQEAIEIDYGIVLNEKEATELLPNWVAYFDLLAKIDFRDKTQKS